MPGVGETQIHKNVVSMSPNYPNGTLASEYMVTLETVAVVENRDRKAAGGNCYLGFMEDHLNRSNEQYKKIYLEDCDCRLMTPTFQNVGPNMTLYTAGSSFTYPTYPDFQLNITGAFSSSTFQRELNGTGHFATYTPGALKISATLSGWPWSAVNSSLMVYIRFTFTTPELGLLSVKSTQRGREVAYTTPTALLSMELDTSFIGDGVWYQTQYDDSTDGDGTAVRSAVYGIGLCDNHSIVHYQDLLYDPTLTVSLLGGVATPDTPPAITAKRNPVWVPIVATVCVVVAAAVVGVVFFLWYRNRDDRLKSNADDYRRSRASAPPTSTVTAAPPAAATTTSTTTTASTKSKDDSARWTKYNKRGTAE